MRNNDDEYNTTEGDESKTSDLYFGRSLPRSLDSCSARSLRSDNELMNTTLNMVSMIRSVMPAWLCLVVASIGHADEIDFNRDIRPILSENCFHCHGPDIEKQEAGLRLDQSDEVFTERADGGGAVIVRNHPEESELWRRVSSSGSDKVMPPADSNRSLSKAEKELLKRWIEQGAEYSGHWAFEPLPERVDVPETSRKDWGRNPIDQFVLAELERQELAPSAPAEPLRWLRRVTLDLTGLPPTVGQIAEFEECLETGFDTAFERAVESLLDSRAYGEQMAVPWLDASRYADTFGYHSDSTFTPWPYRDWVVRAFNTDMPYDEFIKVNLAGDLLPGANTDQKLATAFNRLHRITNEGGSVYEEFFVDGVADRVHTVGTAFLGLTLECARCHDHKYDPITQRDYYSLFAFFNSINETGVYNHQNISPPPSLLLPSPEQQQELYRRNRVIAELEQRLDAIAANATSRFKNWHTNPRRELPMPDRAGYFSFDEQDGPFENAVGSADSDAKASKITPYKASLDKPTFVSGHSGTAVKLDGDRGVVFENFFLKDRWHPFTLSFWQRDTVHRQSC
jgi:hypothetical protein